MAAHDYRVFDTYTGIGTGHRNMLMSTDPWGTITKQWQGSTHGAYQPPTNTPVYRTF